MRSRGSLIHGIGAEDPNSLRSKVNAEISVLLHIREVSIGPQVGLHHVQIHGEQPDPLMEVDCGVAGMFLEREERQDWDLQGSHPSFSSNRRLPMVCVGRGCLLAREREKKQPFLSNTEHNNEIKG